MVSLYTVFYNWTRLYKSLRVTPAMEAGLTDRLWSMQDFAELIPSYAGFWVTRSVRRRCEPAFR